MPNEPQVVNSDDAKNRLKTATEEQDIWAVVKEAIANLITLEITTEVTGGAETVKLVTRLDLFQADRTNEIHQSFLKDPALAPLRDFHAEQIKLAEQDVQGKLEFLQRMASGIIGIMRGEKEAATEETGD